MAKWLLTVLLFAMVGSLPVVAQQPGNEEPLPHLVRAKIEGNDTIPEVYLQEVLVYGKDKRKNKRDRARYDRLVYNVKKTLPYARVAAKRLNEINAHLATLETEKEQKKYLKDAEKQLFAEFETPLRKLTFSQGRLLIKLIDRETGDTSFSLVKEYRGSVSAFFWQSVARLFGANLKSEYETDGEDQQIEQIINQIDRGLL
ncbi:MAG: DUF4294 domain-containing protein [Breznakibacter sp.]